MAYDQIIYTSVCNTCKVLFFVCAYILLLQLIRSKLNVIQEMFILNWFIHMNHFVICTYRNKKGENPTLIKDRYHLFGIWFVVRLILTYYYFNKIMLGFCFSGFAEKIELFTNAPVQPWTSTHKHMIDNLQTGAEKWNNNSFIHSFVHFVVCVRIDTHSVNYPKMTNWGLGAC